LGDLPFNLNVTSTLSDQISYNSSDENVALVDYNGNLTIVGVGDCVITATQNQNTVSKTLRVILPRICGNLPPEICNYNFYNYKLILSGDENNINLPNTKHKLIASTSYSGNFVPFYESEYIPYNSSNLYYANLNSGDYKVEVKTLHNDPTVFPCCPVVGVEVLNLIDYTYSNKTSLCVFNNNFLTFISGFLAENPYNQVSNIYFADNPFFISGFDLTRNTGDLINTLVKSRAKEKEYERSCVNKALDLITGKTLKDGAEIAYINWNENAFKVINIITNNLPLLETFHKEEDDCKTLDPNYHPAVGTEITGFYQKLKDIKNLLNPEKTTINFVYSDKDLNLNLDHEKSFINEQSVVLMYQKAAEIVSGSFFRNSIAPIFQSINAISNFTCAGQSRIELPQSSSSSSIAPIFYDPIGIS
jgi:hypothetical protein